MTGVGCAGTGCRQGRDPYLCDCELANHIGPDASRTFSGPLRYDPRAGTFPGFARTRRDRARDVVKAVIAMALLAFGLWLLLAPDHVHGEALVWVGHAALLFPIRPQVTGGRIPLRRRARRLLAAWWAHLTAPRFEP